MKHIALVASRELQENFRARSYWVTMGFLVAAVVAGIVLPRLFGGDTRYELGLAGDPPPGVEADLADLATAFDVGLDVEALADRAGAEQAVADEEVGAALVFADGRAELVRRVNTPETLAAIANQAAVSATVRQSLLDAGLDQQQAQAALTVPPPAELTVDGDQPARSFVAFLIGLVLYLALFTGGMGVAVGVAGEKSSRIAEILVVSLRPTHLLTGKVIGVGIATLLLVLAGAVPFMAAVSTGLIDLPAVAVMDVVVALGWFLLGYGIYATAFASMGALVDRQEDLSAAVGPFSAALVLSYFASIQASAAPNSTLARFTSMFPLSAPVVMPVRSAEGTVPAWEIAVAVGSCVACFLLFVRVGAVIYRRALLRGGRRLTVREVLARA